MALNNKNPETCRLVEDLAKLTGENKIEALAKAVRGRLERVRSHSGQGLAERLLEIGKECAAHLKEPFRSSDHSALLYDEKGRPR